MVGPIFLGGRFPAAKENWLENLDETLRQHGVNRCDEGAKFLGEVCFFFGGGRKGWFLVGGWGGFGIRSVVFWGTYDKILGKGKGAVGV